MLLQLYEPGQTPLPHQENRLILGIDLGTTHSLVALRDAEGVRIVVEKTPSVLAYDGQKFIVGDQALTFSDALYSVKRLMTQPKDQNLNFEGLNQPLSPIQASAEILKYLKQQAEEKLGCPVKEIVLTVPAYFDDTARTATRDAARLGGLEVVRMINEPTAAALAYGLETGAEGLYGIYDLGGGTFDFSVLRLEKGIFQVLATGGDTHLGGDDFDRCLQSLLPAPLTPPQLRALKEQLSLSDVLHQDSGSIPRQDYEALIHPLVARTLTICQDVLKDAALNPQDLKGLVLVGGATYTPLVRKQTAAFFGQTPLTDINPHEPIALGAAHQAYSLATGQGALLLDVSPLSLGLEMMGGMVEKIIPRHSPIPTSVSQEFTTFKDGQRALLIHVVQGEREQVKDCRSLAQFELDGIPPMMAGSARIQVTFTLDADGLLSVSAREKTTGILQTIEVKPTYGLDTSEIDAMIATAYSHAKEDQQAKSLIDGVIKAKRLDDITQKALGQDGDLLSDEEKNRVLKALTDLQHALESPQQPLLDEATKALEAATHTFAELRLNKALDTAYRGMAINSI